MTTSLSSTTRVRCPVPDCACVFDVASLRLGRNTRCPDCGRPMTARPIEVEAQLEAQQARLRGAPGADVPRLPFAVLIDNVRSLWNVGSIFRTADACGVRKIALSGITGHPPRPQIAKTALGAEHAVGWFYRADPVEALDELVAEGYEPVAMETSSGALPLERLDWPERPCLVVGNEVAGLSADVLEACPRRVYIPMMGVKDSLNVAVAFGIAAYDAARSLARVTR